ncbi:MAG: hypothetical protein K2X48_15360 [Chitinophagaceae bacterium]|nr:hypothetical protein [Chitinophagaceae bacterium]
MRVISTVLVVFVISQSTYCQKPFQMQQAGFLSTYGTTKFQKTGVLGGNFGIPVILSNPPNKTVFVLDILPSASFYVNKRVNLFTYAGFEAHKIRSIFEDYGYPPFYTNYLWKIGAGPELRVIGKRTSVVNIKLQTIFTYEDFIRNKSGPFGSFDTFGNGYLMFDYDGSKARIGLDVMPFIDVQITPKASVRGTVGYSIGLNKSNRRAFYSRALLATGGQGIEAFNRKEKTFIFSFGFYTDIKRGGNRKHMRLRGLFY